MFERFTDGARRVVVLAQEEARLLNHNYIGTEHLLLGLLAERRGAGAKALEALGISRDAVVLLVQEIVGEGGSAPSGHIPFTPRAKKVLELSMRESIRLGHDHIGTEHILLGLTREGEGVAATALVTLGADHDRVRAQVTDTLSGYEPGVSDAVSPGDEPVSAVRAIRGAPAMFFGANPTTQCSFCGRDLWEVDHYIAAAGASICPDCVAASQDALGRANTMQSAWGPLQLPPRVFGSERSDPDAVRAIERAFRTVFSDSESDDARADALEDGPELLPTLAEARQRVPAVGPVRVHVQRLRFLDEHHARVGFAILLSGGSGPTFEGAAQATDGVWQVSRDTFCRVVAMAGVRCPPRAASQPS